MVLFRSCKKSVCNVNLFVLIFLFFNGLDLLNCEKWKKCTGEVPKLCNVTCLPQTTFIPVKDYFKGRNYSYREEFLQVSKCNGCCEFGRRCKPTQNGTILRKKEVVITIANDRLCNVIEVEEHTNCTCTND